ncbi:MAG: prepilin-type N-terminal cleavage/methylation domain-containing protein [Actinomycetota bacterium]|nr:prepilin-type N-terminal cleavage/methylation domain-containing protein [Actinomycetota bacterium]
MRTRDEWGFSVIELLVAIAILAILAASAAFALGTTSTGRHRPSARLASAAVASCRSTVKSVQTALEAYKAQAMTGSYPATLEDLTAATTTAGPWLRQVPRTVTTTLSRYGWALVTYRNTTGTFKVATAHGGTRPTRTPTACKGA